MTTIVICLSFAALAVLFGRDAISRKGKQKLPLFAGRRGMEARGNAVVGRVDGIKVRVAYGEPRGPHTQIVLGVGAQAFCIGASAEFYTGDADFDASFSLAGTPRMLAYAFGPDQRNIALRLTRAGWRLSLTGGELSISSGERSLEAVDEALELGLALARHFTAPSGVHAQVWATRARFDPLPVFRAEAILALASVSRVKLDSLIPSLREDAHPMVLLSFARVTGAPGDVTAATRALMGHADAGLAKGLMETLGAEEHALTLLTHRSTEVCRLAVAWLASRGSLAAVPKLRTLEAHAQGSLAEACDHAVHAIQNRAGVNPESAGAMSPVGLELGLLSRAD
jgi:hypothetical protein